MVSLVNNKLQNIQNIQNYFIKKFKLGIFMNQEKLVNHRSLLKIILNPLLRFFGFDIKSIVIYKLFEYNDYYILKIKRIDYRIGKDKTNNSLKWDFLGNNMNQYNIWIPIIKRSKINYKIQKIQKT